MPCGVVTQARRSPLGRMPAARTSNSAGPTSGDDGASAEDMPLGASGGAVEPCEASDRITLSLGGDEERLREVVGALELLAVALDVLRHRLRRREEERRLGAEEDDQAGNEKRP